jgi:4-hydroxy-3-polyprenylbenzoate decarboxylase
VADLPVVVAITGASGAPYGVRLVDALLAAGREIHLTISPSGQAVFTEEIGRRLDLDRFDLSALLGKDPPTSGRCTYHHYKNLMAPIASGSFLTAAMVICPCSGSTLAAVAHCDQLGVGNALVRRWGERS